MKEMMILIPLLIFMMFDEYICLFSRKFDGYTVQIARSYDLNRAIEKKTIELQLILLVLFIMYSFYCIYLYEMC